ncbi:MAG: galactokinase [Bacteroidetes bacterium]|nr:galactokinase [Bacteroidota bacterium]
MKNVKCLVSKFKEMFSKNPLIIRSPGRINLIGEHTDYNEGFVLPAAIDKNIFFVISPRDDKKCLLYAADLNDDFEFDLNNFCKSEKVWPNYLIGVVDQLKKSKLEIQGFNCVFGGDIPIGAGLSSSAAIEAGLAFALNEIFELNIEKINLVKLSQRAENEFVGVQCGIMDQFINIFGKENKVLKLDCRTLEFEYYPFELNDLQIVLCDTQVKHSLASGKYNARRTQCEEGVRILRKFNNKIHTLRDVDLEFLNSHRSELDPTIFKRCKYVLNENSRVDASCRDLENGDFISFGRRMYESHEGLRYEYEVSCKELDTLAEIASNHEAVLGARMMGGGFGGCTINLVKKDGLEDFKEKIEKKYFAHFGKSIKFYITRIESGTSIISEFEMNRISNC